MSNQDVRNFTVKWSSKLEELADGLLRDWRSGALSPFQKICIVIHDSATENWLKQYFLLDKKISQVLMGIDFVRLPQFLNDWLGAAVRGIDPRFREAGIHPYSREVLTWRIYHILSRADRNGDLKVLLDYIGEERHGAFNFLKCYNLSAKLAALYDDYLNSRCQMLRNWETGQAVGGSEIPRWQISLYQQLVQENNQTYAADYEKAFSPDLKASSAFEHGFPEYRAIHVFDISFMSEPELHLLEKISYAMPMTFWTFNPQGDWLGETTSKSEAIRKLRKEWAKQRSSLQKDGWLESPGESSSLQDIYDSSAERLLGALASGARAMIQNLCDDADGDVEQIGMTEALEELGGREIQIHSNYSPRRELEAIKDGLLDFFDKHPDARPQDAVVLCADWESYAPIIESVFSASMESHGYIPVKVAGGVMGESPFCQSLQALLAFRRNRFEISAVFNLLRTPIIQQKFALEGNAVDSLCSMAKEANIHWGYDDADVRRILGIEENTEVSPYVFTWQRGLDRMITEMFYGFREEDCIFMNAGDIGTLRPCGEVEGERAVMLAKLWKFIQSLYQMRQDLAAEKQYTPEELRCKLQGVIREFYDESVCQEAQQTMRAISAIANQMTDAGIEQIGVEVFLAALDASLSSRIPGMRPVGDAVLFAPLNCATATPHKLVWVCGLNDGRFPKIEYHASYDIIGKHPSLFDVSMREKDAFALLKAVLSARERLCLSYVGMNNHTNEEIAPSVLLNDVRDFFDEEGIPYVTYKHPMNAYSLRYFTNEAAGNSLPSTYSSQNEEIAKRLKEQVLAGGHIPFPLATKCGTELQLEKLAEFFSEPSSYLFQERDIQISRQDELFEDKEAFYTNLWTSLKTEAVLTGHCHEKAAAMQVEVGRAPDEDSANAEIENLCPNHTRTLPFGGSTTLLADAYAAFEAAEPQDMDLDLTVDGRMVRIHQRYAKVELDGRKCMIFYEPNVDFVRNRILLYHLGANAAEGGIDSVAFGIDEKAVLHFPALSQEEAKSRLAELVALGNTPLPEGYPDFQNDVLPTEWQEKLSAMM